MRFCFELFFLGGAGRSFVELVHRLQKVSSCVIVSARSLGGSSDWSEQR